MGKSRVWLFHMQSSEWIDKGDDWLYRANTKIPKLAQEFNYTNISFDILCTHQEFHASVNSTNCALGYKWGWAAAATDLMEKCSQVYVEEPTKHFIDTKKSSVMPMCLKTLYQIKPQCKRYVFTVPLDFCALFLQGLKKSVTAFHTANIHTTLTTKKESRLYEGCYLCC